MLFWLAFVGGIIFLAFALVVFVGPPYLPTRRKQVEAALDLLNMKEGETLLDLGSGDGRVMLEAAKRGLKVVGVEINPLLVLISIAVTWRYRSQVRLVWGSYWGKPWPRADGVFTFMLPRYMDRLDKRIEKWLPEGKSIKLASFAFAVPGKEPIDKRDGVLLYEYK
ncbi:MAG TPA: class I SAM-dependent methyltransferase [Candidatus Saccharimonadales bacterium]